MKEIRFWWCFFSGRCGVGNLAGLLCLMCRSQRGYRDVWAKPPSLGETGNYWKRNRWKLPLAICLWGVFIHLHSFLMEKVRLSPFGERDIRNPTNLKAIAYSYIFPRTFKLPFSNSYNQFPRVLSKRNMGWNFEDLSGSFHLHPTVYSARVPTLRSLRHNVWLVRRRSKRNVRSRSKRNTRFVCFFGVENHKGYRVTVTISYRKWL